MSASLSGVFNLQEFSDAGPFMALGRLYTYAPSTTTQKLVYTDPAGTISHTYTSDGIGGQYIGLNARGELPAPMFLLTGGYDIALKTPAGATVWTRRAIGEADAAADVDTAIRADLANKTDPAKGGALVGIGSDQAYPPGSVGWALTREIDVTAAPYLAHPSRTASDNAGRLQQAANDAGALVDGSGLSQTILPTLVFPQAGGGYHTNATLTIPGGVGVVMHAPLMVEATNVTPIIGMILGPTSTLNQNWRNLKFDLDVRRVTQSTWGSESDICVQVQGVYASDIFLRRLDNFTIGCQFTGTYNRVDIGEIRNCKFGLDIVDTAYNFTNQNQFYGGEIACIGGVNPGVSRYGIRLNGQGHFAINTNTFIGQSYELNAAVAGVGEAICIISDGTGASTCKFMEQRSESNDLPIARWNGDTRQMVVEDFRNNEFDSPQKSNLVDNSTYKIGNRIKQYRVPLPESVCIFDSGWFSNNYCAYNGTTYYFRDLESLLNTDPATFQPQAAGTFNADGSVTLSNTFPLGVGRRVNVTQCKSIVFELDAPVTSDVAIEIVLFDASGGKLTANTDVLQDVSTPTITPNTGLAGGLYTLTTSADYPRRRILLTFSASVATAWIGVAAGDVFGFRLYAVDGDATTFTAQTRAFEGELIATQSPQTSSIGTHSIGTHVRNAVPTVGQPKGWYCTVAGTPGTWVSEGNL